eukprot:765539-Hanusia_phi.AAC.8
MVQLISGMAHTLSRALDEETGEYPDASAPLTSRRISVAPRHRQAALLQLGCSRARQGAAKSLLVALTCCQSLDLNLEKSKEQEALGESSRTGRRG